ncbi:hypothetical protein [Pseudokineococcus sp. 1T1Z-3]|uniref:hypothetical protein n=1 Tax=Pseudokineococcus sp. 1T1Z-3 TaxID=3132745 RepID=UPI0030AC5220
MSQHVGRDAPADLSAGQGCRQSLRADPGDVEEGVEQRAPIALSVARSQRVEPGSQVDLLEDASPQSVGDHLGHQGAVGTDAQEVDDGPGSRRHRGALDQGHVCLGQRGSMDADTLTSGLVPARDGDVVHVVDQVAEAVQARGGGRADHPRRQVGEALLCRHGWHEAQPGGAELELLVVHGEGRGVDPLPEALEEALSASPASWTLETPCSRACAAVRTPRCAAARCATAVAAAEGMLRR